MDVETANEDYSCICQVGIVHVRDGRIEESWETLVKPKGDFRSVNTDIHGIRPIDVKDAPALEEVWQELQSRLNGGVLVHHGHFDRSAFTQAADRHGLEPLQATWLDSAKLVRRALPDKYGRKGYGLPNVASDMGMEYSEHDALEDAATAAKVVLNVCAETCKGIEHWLHKVNGTAKQESQDVLDMGVAAKQPAKRKRAGNVTKGAAMKAVALRKKNATYVAIMEATGLTLLLQLEVVRGSRKRGDCLGSAAGGAVAGQGHWE